VSRVLIELVLGPLLVATSTLAARRWGCRVGGAVSAFPAIVGPVLLVDALGHGATFAARAASGTLLGLVALAAFALGYARSVRAGPGWALVAGWASAGLAAAAAGLTVGDAGGLTALLLAMASVLGAWQLLPRHANAHSAGAATAPDVGIPVRMALTASLVAALSALATALGPLVGGILAALPVLASLLAVLTHRADGPGATISLLGGMLAGMIGFIAFCECVALLVARYGIAPAFLSASLLAALVQAASVVGLRSQAQVPRA
jgi:hypothetical protein